MKQYIEDRFSNELKLLISLSQNEIDVDFITGILSEINWDLFIQLVLKHRLVSHILKHINKIENQISDEIISSLKEIKLNQSKTSLEYTSILIKINDLFQKKNIKYISFKGPLLSLELYDDIGFRNFRDIDILVEKENIEEAKNIIENLNFKNIYPRIPLSNQQRKVNYSISHHYHFTHNEKPIEIELHWNITNPQSFFGVATKDIISNSKSIDISNYDVSYISTTENLVYQAAHGSIHQWYRLFWLKDFSALLLKYSNDEIKNAWKLSEELKLQNCFIQACLLSHLIYKIELPDFINFSICKNLIKIPLNSIHINDLSQQGLKGKIKFVFYRLQMKPDFKYYFELIYRLRTHLSDWELLKLPKYLFFLYYLLRPFLLVFKFLFRK
ncbi:MAG: nucleotidyltransferase family protein [Bacteroidales bacterium]|nr:nucleotidyltransferase family protein [Bacteroidales bacterium]